VVVVRAWVRVDMVVVVVVVVDERWPRGFFSSVVVRAFAQLGALCIVLVEMCVCVCVRLVVMDRCPRCPRRATQGRGAG
jgi:hypothetical protein